MQTNANLQRLYYLDAVRAFALLLGVVFHASLSFFPSYIGWAVMDISTSEFVSVFMLISHSFRMELFFVIAGFFSCMALSRQPINQYLKSRTIRLGIPLLIGWFILRPLLVSGWVIGGQSMRGDVDIWQGIVAGFSDLMQLPSGFLVGTHLWFLYYLILISALLLILKVAVSSLKMDNLLFRHCTKLFASRLSPLILITLAVIITSCSLWFMSSWGMDTPDKSLVPHWPTFAVYSLCFGIGWLLFTQQEMFNRLTDLSWTKFTILSLSVLASIYFVSFQSQYGTSQYLWYKINFVFSYAIMMWTLVFFTIAICKRVFINPNAVISYLSGAAYWIYLIHLPIVIYLQIVVAELEVNWLVKWLGVTIVTIIISVFSYEFLVRKTLLGVVLNGKKNASKREVGMGNTVNSI
jgi:peptidoglycan/LPS O-acetylase OafA/YrhL